MFKGIEGLSTKEVIHKKSLGLSNQTIDTYSPSVLTIIRRNTFNIINSILVPLIIALASFRRWGEVTVFSIFIFVNSILSALDEIRVKKRLDALHKEFQQEAHVVRDGELIKIPVNEVVKGDFVYAKEGEGIIADGKIRYENFLQVDQAMLTGESDYIRKLNDETVLSGSFVVTGDCIYEVDAVGKNNYLNKLGAEATRYSRGTSGVQRAGNSLIIFFIVSALVTGALNFLLIPVSDSVSLEDKVVALTSIFALIIPQTLIFLFTLSFSISVTKLSNRGILIQKKGAIDDLANIDIVCMDKTGTITTNKMKLKETRYWNFEEKEIGTFYKAITEQIVGRNKTQEVLDELFFDYKADKVKSFDQLPFNSKQKYSVIQAEVGERFKRVIFGAPSILLPNVNAVTRKKVQRYIDEMENQGFRTLMSLYSLHNEEPKLDTLQKTDKVAIYVIEETLNPGIENVINQLIEQQIALKIISGDSLKSVSKIAEKIGISTNEIVDLSESLFSVEELALTKTIFARAKPEDKLAIIKSLQEEGHRVAMIGDGVNDVLGMKFSEVGIAMESGSKITRDIADIVLLKNDYQKIPQIFFEGDNLIFNLKISSKMFLAKAITTIFITNLFTFVWRIPLPILPTSTLVFSFLGSTLPSYILALTRQQVKNTRPFMQEIVSSALPVGLLTGVLIIYIFLITQDENYNLTEINTSLTVAFSSANVIYSLYLLKTANKLKSWLVSGYIYILLMLAGIAATILPITKYPNNPDYQKALFAGIFVYTVLLFVTTRKIIRTKNQKVIKSLYLIIFPGVLIFLIFPFRDYYALTPIPVYIYYHIFVISLASIVALAINRKVEVKLFG